MKREETKRVLRTNGDVLATLQVANDVGWEGVKEVNIHRIIYISSVLYSFKNPDKENPFIADYNFIISLRGPYSDEIKRSLVYLKTQKFIFNNDKQEYQLHNENVMTLNLEILPNFIIKKNWIETIIYIIGIYGEDKIYDFVFRDPEYQDNVHRNSITNLNLDIGNETYKNLVEMKQVFESVLGDKAETLDNREYLELYFQYVFSKIIKGDIN